MRKKIIIKLMHTRLRMSRAKGRDAYIRERETHTHTDREREREFVPFLNLSPTPDIIQILCLLGE